MVKSFECCDDPAAIILARRTELSLSRSELAARAGLQSADLITLIEKGMSPVPLERSVDLAKALEMRDPISFIKKVLQKRYPVVFDAVVNGKLT